MSSTPLTIYIMLAYILKPMVCQTLDQSMSLMSDMLNGYDRRHRPILNQSLPLQVNITFNLLFLQDFDELKEAFSAGGWLVVNWYDEKLRWNSTQYGGVSSQQYAIKDVWHPIIILANPDENIRDIAADWMTVRVHEDGLVLLNLAAVFKTRCSADLSFYPFDSQICHMQFASFGYMYSEVFLYSARSDAVMTIFTESNEWELTKTRAAHDSIDAISTITLWLHLERKPQFLILNIILPIIFLAIINSIVFILPAESGERISFAMTVLLSIAVFMTLVGDNLPKISRPVPILCYYIMLTMVLSVVICIINALSLRLYHVKQSIKVPKLYVKLTQKVNMLTGSTPVTSQRKLNVIVPNEKALTEHATDADIAHDVKRRDDDVTWKDVSVAVDNVALIIFFIATVSITSVFISIMSLNRNV